MPSFFLFFFKSNLPFRHAHTASIKSALFALHVIASRHSNLESGLIMPLPRWILVHSACELRGNELILPVSAPGMVMLQTPRRGKRNEEAPEVDPALRIGFFLSPNQGWDDFRLALLRVNIFMEMFQLLFWKSAQGSLSSLKLNQNPQLLCFYLVPYFPRAKHVASQNSDWYPFERSQQQTSMCAFNFLWEKLEHNCKVEKTEM